MNKKERIDFFYRNLSIKELSRLNLNVVEYLRVSKKKTDNKNNKYHADDSLDNQRMWFDDIMKTRFSNWKVVKEYYDEGITGTSIVKRKNFQQMIKDAQSDNCNFSIVLIRELSRMNRNVKEYLESVDELKKEGVIVYSINDNLLTSDPNHTLIANIMATMAENESKKISSRVKDGKKTRQQIGDPNGCGNILGYVRVKHSSGDINPLTNKTYKGRKTHYEIDPVQAVTVKKIFRWYLDGDGYSTICNKLMRDGDLTASGLATWQPTVIRHILTNKTYCGYVGYGLSENRFDIGNVKRINNRDKAEYTKGDFESIISEEDFNKVQAIFANKALNKENKYTLATCKYLKPTIDNMWLRKLYCSCGSAFSRNKWHKKGTTIRIEYGYNCKKKRMTKGRDYRLKHGLPLIDDMCNVNDFSEIKLLTMAQYIIKQYWDDNDNLFETVVNIVNDCYQSNDTDGTLAEINRYEELIKSIETEIKKYQKGYELGIYDENEIAEKVKACRKKIKDFRTEQDILQSKIKQIESKEDIIQNLYTKLEEFKSDERALLGIVDSLVYMIIVHEDYFLWVLRPSIDNAVSVDKRNTKQKELIDLVEAEALQNIKFEKTIDFDEYNNYRHKLSGLNFARKDNFKDIVMKVAVIQ